MIGAFRHHRPLAGPPTWDRGMSDYLREPGDDTLAERQQVAYNCPHGHQFDVTFAEGAEPPDAWRCRQHGANAPIADPDIPAWVTDLDDQRPGLTHWDQVCSRRTAEERAQHLDAQLRALRAGGLVGVEQWLKQQQAVRPPVRTRGAAEGVSP